MHSRDPHTPIEETLRTLDDLLRAGKLRYLGFSDTSAWRVAQAQTLASLRGWSPLIAVQFEYSLAERTREDNLGAGVVALPAEAVARLDQLSAPPPQWISLFDTLGPMQMHGGMTVHDLTPPLSPLAPKPGDKLY